MRRGVFCIAGHGYRHYIEATVFGYPVMKVNEYYFDGKARMELPEGRRRLEQEVFIEPSQA